MTTTLDMSPDSAPAKNNQSSDRHSSAFHAWLVKPKSIVISIFAVFILISGMAIFFIYEQNRDTGVNLLSDDENNAALIAGSIQKHSKTVLEIIASYAQGQSFINAVKKKDTIEARRQLASLKKAEDFNLALITDKRGLLWANFPAFPVGSNLSYREWYKQVSTDWKPHVSEVFQITSDDKPLVTAFSVPVFDGKTNPIGILTIYKKIIFLVDSVKQVSPDQNTTVHVIDQAGNIIFDSKSDFQKKVTGYSLFPVIKKALMENKKQIKIQNQQTNQKMSYLSIARVEGTDWLVIVQRDFENNLPPQQAGNPAAIIIIFVLLFIILSVSLIYIRKIIISENIKDQLLFEINLLSQEKMEWEKRYHPESRDNQKNIPLIVWDHDLKIVRFDQAFEKMTGWSKDEVLGKKIDILFPENSKKESLDRINTAAISENPEVLEVPILHSDGKTAVAHGHYITERKPDEQESIIFNRRLERRVAERTSNLEAAKRRLESLSYSISQALLTPMQTIENLCGIMNENYQATPDAVEKNHLERISREITHMRQLIDDMQKLLRLNRPVINRQSVDASKIVRELMEVYKQKYPERDVSVSIEKEIIIDGDETLIKVALENLIDNAWKFTISKESAVIKFGSTLKDGKKALFIRDNGAGFDMAHVNRLFGFFHRIDTSTDVPETGTGTGLATVKWVVDCHGGEIWAESKLGKGATFYFTLSS